MKKKKISDEAITEEMVEGIYCEHQHKIETLPGYAEAFKRLYDCMSKAVQNDKPNKHDQEELGRAMAEVYITELKHRYSKPK